MRRRTLLGAAASAASVLAADTARAATLLPVPLKILCIGDSITRGWGDSVVDSDPPHAGYRRRLSKLLHGAGVEHTYTIRAIDGSTAAQWTQWAGYEVGQAMPDLVLLYLGVNDANPSTGVLATFEANYRKVLSDIAAAKPGVAICVGWVQHVAASWDANTQAVRDAQWRIFNGTTPPAGIVGKADFGSLPTGLLYDGIHPSTPVGYDLFASQWFDALSGYLGLPAT